MILCVYVLDGQVLHARFDNMPRINNNILHCWIPKYISTDFGHNGKPTKFTE